ncbi:MAG: helix-turn-helix domain-containing protein [Hyphomicrobiaceae bacterium]
MLIRRPSDLGAILRDARQQRGLNQKELADRLGVARRWVNQFEGGKPTARLDIVLRALAELEITLEASTDASNTDDAESGRRPVPSQHPIDIDEIADAGLSPARSTSRPTTSRRRR